MNELVYKLQLPPLEEILLPGAKEKYFPADHKYTFIDASDIIKPEWLEWNNIVWKSAVVFYKPNGFIGTIHSDVPPNSPIIPWGINFVHGGYGTMDYWTNNSKLVVEHSTTLQGRPMANYIPSSGPDKSYLLENNSAYLVNAKVPHLPKGYGNRYVLSLRADPSFQLSKWDDVVSQFTNYM